MFLLDRIKDRISLSETLVECPVKNCDSKIIRRHQGDPIQDLKFMCQTHRIYVYSSTFEYVNVKENYLWIDDDELKVLDSILQVKHESRMARANSEDAVTWNVFRFLERNALLASVVGSLAGVHLTVPECLYWSYSQSEGCTWSALSDARNKFGELGRRTTEPDLIVKDTKTLIFIEAKVGAPNRMNFNRSHTPNQRNERIRRYSGADHNLLVPISSILDDGYYELMRNWVVGSHIARELGLDFYLVNLVLSRKEKDIEGVFRTYLSDEFKLRFLRITWEDIYGEIAHNDLVTPDMGLILDYFKSKISGWDATGKTQRTFSVQ